MMSITKYSAKHSASADEKKESASKRRRSHPKEEAEFAFLSVPEGQLWIEEGEEEDLPDMAYQIELGGRGIMRLGGTSLDCESNSVEGWQLHDEDVFKGYHDSRYEEVDLIGAPLLLPVSMAAPRHELIVRKPSAGSKTYVFVFRVGEGFEAVVTDEAKMCDFRERGRALTSAFQHHIFRESIIHLWFQSGMDLTADWWGECTEGLEVVTPSVICFERGCTTDNVRLVITNALGEDADGKQGSLCWTKIFNDDSPDSCW